MITTIGIDPSLSHSAIVVGTDGIPVAHFLIDTTDYKVKEKKIYTICRLIHRVIVVNKPDFTIIEGYSMASVRSKAATSLHELGGAIRQVFFKLELPWHEIPPKTIKAFAGHGKASKEEMIAWAQSIWPECPTQNDLADAFWCMRYAFEKYNNLITPVV